MFTTNFQSAVAVAKNMMPVVGTLTNDPAFLEELRKEVDGKVRACLLLQCGTESVYFDARTHVLP